MHYRKSDITAITLLRLQNLRIIAALRAISRRTSSFFFLSDQSRTENGKKIGPYKVVFNIHFLAFEKCLFVICVTHKLGKHPS